MFKLNNKFLIAVAILAFFCYLSIYLYTKWDLKQVDAELGAQLLLHNGQHHNHDNCELSHTGDSSSDTHKDIEKQVKISSVKQEKFMALPEVDKEEAKTTKKSFADFSSTDLQKLKVQLDDINGRIQRKYPDIIELQTLTREEIATRYPTDAARRALAARGHKLLEDFLYEVHESFSQAPEEWQEYALVTIHLQLAQTWGVDEANLAMEHLRKVLGN